MAARQEANSAAQEQSPQPRLGELAGIASGTAAAFVGVLYVAGGLYRAGALAARGYSVRDALPLTPVQQILANGLGLFLDPAVLLAASFFLMYGWQTLRGVRLQEKLWQDWVASGIEESRAQREAAVNLTGWVLAELSHVPGVGEDELRALVSRHGELLAEAKTLTGDTSEVDVLRYRIAELGRDTRRLAGRNGLKSAYTRHLARSHRRWQLPLLFIARRGKALWIALLLAALALPVFLVPIPRLPVYLAFYWPLLLFVPRVRRLRGFALRVVCTLPLVAAVLASAYLNPHALQRARVELVGGRVIEGDLVASDSTVWYVGGASAIRGIPLSTTIDAQLTRGGRAAPHANTTLFQLLTATGPRRSVQK